MAQYRIVRGVTAEFVSTNREDSSFAVGLIAHPPRYVPAETLITVGQTALIVDGHVTFELDSALYCVPEIVFVEAVEPADDGPAEP